MNVTRRSFVLPSLAIASAASLFLGACSAPPADGGASERAERVGRVSSPVINGKDSDKTQDAVVLLVRYDPRTGEFGQCTGTMLSDRLVLTARHCVADTDETAACDVKGEPLAEGVIRGNYKADTLYVFTGPNRPNFGRGEVNPAGQGLRIIDDGGKNLCNHDIALLILKEPVKDVKIASIRLDGPIEKGEALTAVGWGVTDTSPQPDVRQQRTGIKVQDVGPSETDSFPVPPNEFQVGESICSGDSGGPALASTGAIVGIVSRGGNARRPDPRDPASSCINGENLYTKVDTFKDFILQGYELVEADPWYENGADPRLLKPGAACDDASECRSNLCLATPGAADAATTCAQDCSADKACPEGLLCTAEGEAQVCRAPAPPAKTTTTTTSGCSAAPGATSPGSLSSQGALGLLIAAVGLVAARRRRR